MKLMKLENTPKEYYGCGREVGDLSEYEVRDLKEKGIEEAYYWYVYESYEGSGYILYRKEDKWYVKSMGHCSCYGPLEDLDFTHPYDSLEDVLLEATNDYISYVGPLVELAMEQEE